MWNFSKINSLLIRLVKKNTDFSKQIDMTSIFFNMNVLTHINLIFVTLPMKTEHNLLWVLDQSRGNLRLVAVVADDGIK